MIYSSWDIGCDGLKLVIISHFCLFTPYGVRQTDFCYHFGPFSPFYPLPSPPLTTQKIKILKKWKKASRDTIIQYTRCVSKIMIIWCMLPEIWSVTDIIFLSFWAIFCPFISLKTLKIKIGKNMKKAWRYYPFTHVYHKWRSYDVSFLKYKAWDRVFFVILDHFLYIDPNNPKNQNFVKWKSLEISSFLRLCTTNDIIWCMLPEILSATGNFL